jgi:putative drug exporter of the RND superfamily
LHGRSSIFSFPSGRRAKWVVFLVWLVGIFVAVGPAELPTKFSDAEQNESTSFLPGEAESTKALTVTEDLQGGELAPAVILYRRDSGLTAADRRKIVSDVAKLTADPRQSKKDFPGVVADGATAASGGPQGSTPQAAAGNSGGAAPQGSDPEAAAGHSGGAPAGAPAGQPRGCGGPTTPIAGQPAGYAPFVGPICSEDGKAALVTAYLKGDGDGDTILDPVNDWRDKVSDPGGGLDVKITGGAGFSADAIEIFESIDGTLLTAALSLVIFLLILIYRSPIFLFIPLIAVVFAEMLSRSLGYLISELGVTINGQSSSIMSILVLGAGTDYALLLVSRYREELHHTADKHEAMRVALGSAGPAIFASAATVIAALFCLTIAKVNGTAGLGPIGALGVACAALSMLTLLPALLTVFGRRAFWPFVPHTPETAPAATEVSDRARKRIVDGPRAVALGTVVASGLAIVVVLMLLGTIAPIVPAIAIGLFVLSWIGRRLGGWLPGPLDRAVFLPYEIRRYKREKPADTTHGLWKRVGDRVAAGPRRVMLGSIAILLVLCAGLAFFSLDLTSNDAYRTEVESVAGQKLLAKSFPAGASSPTDIIVRDDADVAAVGRAVAKVEGVEAVSPPVARGDDGTLLHATLGPQPFSTEAYDLVEPIRAAADSVADSTLVGGPTAVEFDVRDAAAWDSKVIPPIVLVVVFLILVLLLRSVVAPLVLIGTVILSFAAALGVGYFAFDVLFDFPGSDPSLPLFAFVFLVALGVDYNIFLIARAREETQKHGTEQGILRALAVTGGVITSAGIVLAGTFSVLAVLPLVFLTEIGFVVAFGVLLDTFLVRSVLVPSIVLNIGPKFWWPSKLAQEDGGAPPPSPAARRAAPAEPVQSS